MVNLEIGGSPNFEIDQALQRIREQLNKAEHKLIVARICVGEYGTAHQYQQQSKGSTASSTKKRSIGRKCTHLPVVGNHHSSQQLKGRFRIEPRTLLNTQHLTRNHLLNTQPYF
ncbi:hypothetical protein Ccrd_026619 [Cynara cardunculus var. scolymus]|uniref:Uncharacterized protein n=1 Tax=Cynara cardunculus var. scolymus TaxID=59895 RepID=A0A103MCY8_CYNCS|nr:hypothetical protein Ccrd_026619 [Cynara cardunculus var. scolymus]